MKILDNIKLMEFVSKYDDSSRELLLSLPINFVKNKKHPLIITLFPHVSGTISPPTISAHKISRGQAIPPVFLF